jgi:hypothetical protein
LSAWGSDSFENDDASDWLVEFCDDPKMETISDALSALAEMDAAEYPGAPECSVAIAAAEVVAAIKGPLDPDSPDDVKERVSKLKVKVEPGMVSLGLKAIERIKANSELKDLWGESEDFDQWRLAVSKLERRLKQ